jgi:hypothetical protein
LRHASLTRAGETKTKDMEIKKENQTQSGSGLESSACSRLAACEKRAIELYYEHKDDNETTCGEVRQKLVIEFDEPTVAEMLTNGIGNNSCENDLADSPAQPE